MKTSLVIFLALGLISAQNDLSSVGFLTTTEGNDSLSFGSCPLGLGGLQTFMETSYEYFGIYTLDVSNCYNEAQACAQFQYWNINWEITWALMNAETSNLYELVQKLAAVNSTVFSATQCQLESQEFKELMDILNFNYENTEELNQLLKLYGYAHGNDYAITWEIINSLLENEETDIAGELLAPLTERLYSNASLSNQFYEQLKAFHNGLFLYFNLTSPFEMPNCYDSFNSAYGVEFYSQWAQFTVDLNSENAYNQTVNWLSTGDGALLLSAFEPIISCIQQTEDQERLNQVLGYDIYEQTFQDAILDYIEAHPSAYLIVFKVIGEAFLQGYPMTAGLNMGVFYKIVSQTI